MKVPTDMLPFCIFQYSPHSSNCSLSSMVPGPLVDSVCDTFIDFFTLLNPCLANLYGTSMISSCSISSGLCSSYRALNEMLISVGKSLLTLSLLAKFCSKRSKRETYTTLCHRCSHGTKVGILGVPSHNTLYRTCAMKLVVSCSAGLLEFFSLNCAPQRLLLLRQLRQPSCHCHELASNDDSSCSELYLLLP